jgi:acetylornithine deacetylase/succinyl-diaminopimelate desuccinylase-like protein
MKGHGIAQLMTLIAVKRSGVPLARDLVLIGNSDEELLGIKGAAVFVERHRDLLSDVEYVITEGTPNRVEAGRLVHYSVSVAEKLNYSQRLVSRGTPSHGSRPNPANPVLRLLTALNRVASYEPPLIVTPTVDKYFRDIAPMYQGEQRVWLADVQAALGSERARAWVLADPIWHAFLRNTAQITVLTASSKTNVIPAEASAELDVRLLPGEVPDEFMTGLQAAVTDERIEWARVFPLKPRLASPVDTDLFRAIERVARRRDPNAVITTPLVVGGTDMPWYRQSGIVAYGIDPFRVERSEHQRGLHGNDERLPVTSLSEGIDFLYQVLRTLQ